MRLGWPGFRSAGLGLALAAAVVLFVASADVSSAAFPGAEGLIAFQTYRGGNYEIYGVKPDGSGLRNLTRSPACDALPAWSPDGRRIAFERNVRGVSARESDIWVMNADGGNQRDLTRNKWFDGDPAWSSDGRQIAYESTRDGDSEIWVIRSDGTGVRRLTNNDFFDGDPAWSPGGRKIAFTSDRDGNKEIYLMNPDGSDQENLTRNPYDDVDPAWAPSGNLLVFTSTRDGNPELYVASLTVPATRITARAGLDGLAAWSPDGRQIAFVADVGQGNRAIWVMNASGTGARRLTGSSGWDTAPDWQPLRRRPASLGDGSPAPRRAAALLRPLRVGRNVATAPPVACQAP